MRLILFLAATLLLAGCGANPAPVATTMRPVVTPQPSERGDLIGLDANTLAGRFGLPQLQVREGAGTKLQFARGGCILDAYLYPPVSGGGLARVTHIDTRNRDGRSIDQVACIRMFEAR